MIKTDYRCGRSRHQLHAQRHTPRIERPVMTIDIHPIFFALVEPKYVKQEDWNPKAWLIEDSQCFGVIE